MSDMDFGPARFNMVEQQIRPWDVIHPGVLQLLSGLSRDVYVPDAYSGLAYADTEIPLADGQSMMTPRVEARLLQALDIQADDTVLEIGTGSGFLAACLGAMGHHVTSCEADAGLAQTARDTLAAQQVANVHVEHRNIFDVWPGSRQFDAIAVTGSVPAIPSQLEQALRVNGRLFIVVGDAPAMAAMLITRVGEDSFSRTALFETELSRLRGAAEPQGFVF